MNYLQKNRQSAFERQSGKCYYCGFSMWQGCIESFAKHYGLTVKQARHFQCTAEHLVARQDGGRDGDWNIAAACIRCNLLRHKRKVPMQPEQYKTYVRKRVQKGRWHVPSVTDQQRT